MTASKTSAKRKKADQILLSLYPHHVKLADERSAKFGLTRSGYIQRLIAHDEANGVMDEIILKEAQATIAKLAA